MKGVNAKTFVNQRPFGTVMSHAIKTPLNAILGFSDKMMSDASLCAADKEMVAAIHQCGRSMLEMLNDAVYIERIQRGAILLDETRIDLKAFAETIRDMIRKDRGFSGFIDIDFVPTQ